MIPSFDDLEGTQAPLPPSGPSPSHISQDSEFPPSPALDENKKVRGLKGAKRGKRKSKKNDDDGKKKVKVKRVTSAYIYFCRDMRKSMAKDDPSLTFAETTAIIAEKWKALPESDREVSHSPSLPFSYP